MKLKNKQEIIARLQTVGLNLLENVVKEAATIAYDIDLDLIDNKILKFAVKKLSEAYKDELFAEIDKIDGEKD